MKALVCSSLTDDFADIRVEDVDLPEPGFGEVRIRIRATSLNFPDILLCQGKYQLKLEPPFTPGMDIAGEIDAIGEGVKNFVVGEAVVGLSLIHI